MFKKKGFPVPTLPGIIYEGKCQIVNIDLLAYPQVENERRAIKIISGVRAAQKEGRWLGKAPYGYKNERDHTGKPIITPNEKAEVIKTIFSAVAKGESQS